MKKSNLSSASNGAKPFIPKPFIPQPIGSAPASRSRSWHTATGLPPVASTQAKPLFAMGAEVSLTGRHYQRFRQQGIIDQVIQARGYFSLSTLKNKAAFLTYHGAPYYLGADQDALVIPLNYRLPVPQTEYGFGYLRGLQLAQEILIWPDNYRSKQGIWPFRSRTTGIGHQLDFGVVSNELYHVATGAYRVADDTPIRVLFTEDPSSADACVSRGEMALYFDNVVASRAQLLQMLIPTGFVGAATKFRFYVVLNANQEGYFTSYKTVRTLVDLLQTADPNRPDVEIIQLPEYESGKLTTLADVLARGNSIDDVIAQARPFRIVRAEAGAELA